MSTNGTGGLRIGNSAGGAYVNLVTKSFTPTRTHPRAFTVDPALTTYGATPPVAQVRRWLNHATSSTNFAGRGSLHIGYSGDNGNASLANLSASISDLGTDQAGNVFIDDAGNGAVRRVDKATHVITTVTASGGPWAGQLGNGVMFVTPAGDIYASAVGGTQIVRRDHGTGAVTLIAGSGNLHSGCPVPVSTVAVPGTVASITHDGFANTIAVVDLPGAVNPEIWMINTNGVLNKIEANHGAKGSAGQWGPRVGGHVHRRHGRRRRHAGQHLPQRHRRPPRPPHRPHHARDHHRRGQRHRRVHRRQRPGHLGGDPGHALGHLAG